MKTRQGLGFFTVAFLITGLSFAGSVQFWDEIGDNVYGLTRAATDGTVELFCFDFISQALSVNDSLSAAAVSEQLILDKGTDSVLLCQADHVSGAPSFYATQLDYVAGGFQYGVSEYRETRGTLGRLREGASVQFAVFLPEVERGEPFKLYLGDDGIEVTLRTLDDF